ncbi:hypothetical protein K431DRAFT_316067 [Polychaeton citri CBS 116435]|uniref:NAD(P)-binding protein n=1 Tax=Polychaeton citri CBS 116435 TaxID=1314669 RepID=A0A9P4Q2B2_9PEZI|nr:hypothetical protein K431DRAFT_316067 [Polychaeton citri CBS 116435]
MVCYQDVLRHNASLKNNTPGLVALFMGATNGIGLATLHVLINSVVEPRIYVVGRSKAKFSGELERLQEQNRSAALDLIESEISLLCNVDRVCTEISQDEKRLDLLYLSPGYLGFGGPLYMAEGLDTCFVLSLYARMRFVQKSLPLLSAASRPRVVSVLAGGHEKPLYNVDGDLGVGKGGYKVLRAVDQTTTLHTLAFAHLASLHPQVSFLHTYPGWAATDFLYTFFSSLGTIGYGLSSVLNPLWRKVAISAKESGEWHAFFATSERYPSRQMIKSAIFDVNNVAKSHLNHSGLYLVSRDGDSNAGRKVLGPLEEDNWPAKTWTFIEGILQETLSPADRAS